MITEPLEWVKRIAFLIEYMEQNRYNRVENNVIYGCEKLLEAAFIEIARLSRLGH